MGERQITFDNIVLNVNEPMARYIEIRKEYDAISIQAKEEAKAFFEKEFHTYSEFCLFARLKYDQFFKEYLQKTVWKLVSKGIYDIDEVVLRSEIGEDNLTYLKVLDDIIDSIIAIDISREEKKQLGKEITGELGKETAELTSKSGGDSDILSLAKVAGVATIGSWGISKAINYAGQKNDEKKKCAIFESEFNRNKIYAAISEDIYRLNIVFASIVNQRSEGELIYYFPTEEIIEHDQPMVRNIVQGNYLHEPEYPDLEKSIIEQVLVDNPYEKNIYSYLIRKNGGVSSELRSVLNYLGMSTESLADIYLKFKYGAISLNNYEEAVEFEKTIIAELDQFGTDNCEYLKQTAARKEELYVIRRTFNGYVYDTIEIRDEAEAQYTEFLADLDLENMNADELSTAYYETYYANVHDHIKEDLREAILPYIEKELKKIKTVEEIEPYYSDSKNRCIELKLVSTPLSEMIEGIYKRLNLKAKVSSVANAAKEKGKALMSKIPFGKQKGSDKDQALLEGEVADNTEQLSEDNPTENEPEKEGKGKGFMAKGLGGAKGFFKRKKETSNNEKPEDLDADSNAMESADTEPEKKEIIEEPEVKKCPQCGKDVSITKRFCGKCGYRF